MARCFAVVARRLRKKASAVSSRASGRPAAKNLAEAVKVALVGRPHESPGGVIDSVAVEVAASMEPFQSETVCKFTAIYRVETRPI